MAIVDSRYVPSDVSDFLDVPSDSTQTLHKSNSIALTYISGQDRMMSNNSSPLDLRAAGTFTRAHELLTPLVDYSVVRLGSRSHHYDKA